MSEYQSDKHLRLEIRDDALDNLKPGEEIVVGAGTKELDSYLKERLSGKSNKEIFLEGGDDGKYNPARIYSQLRHGTTENYIRNRLANLGMSDDDLLMGLSDCIDAKHVRVDVIKDKDGNEHVVKTETTDYTNKRKAIETAFKLNGMLKSSSVNNNNAPVINNNSVKIDQNILNVTGDDLKKEMLAISRAVQEKRPYSEVRQEVLGSSAGELESEVRAIE